MPREEEFGGSLEGYLQRHMNGAGYLGDLDGYAMWAASEGKYTLLAWGSQKYDRANRLYLPGVPDE